MQPLFNYILWRIHQEMDPVAALESFIFLCNDPRKVNFAKGFDIKTKRLEQLREAIGREDRDYKNRLALQNRESQALDAEVPELTKEPKQNEDEKIEDDEVVFKPPKAPAAMLQKQPNMIDPNAFSRGPSSQPTAKVENPASPPKSPRVNNMGHRGSPRGAHPLPSAPSGNVRGRGNFRGAQRGRGGPFAGRGGFANKDSAPTAVENLAPNSQIDPNSFTRPGLRGGCNTTRGARKLWVPS